MSSSKTRKSTDVEQLELEAKFKELELTLPKQLWFGFSFHNYQGFWCPTFILKNVIAFQTHFEAQDTDIILASLPKTGTTWLKSLLYTILNRKSTSLHTISQQVFQTKNPHELVTSFEFNIYKNFNETQPDLSDLPSPRLFSTHIPFLSLPDSIKSSKSRIVYVCRNPLDTFVSTWHFNLSFDTNKDMKSSTEMMEEYVDKFCTGLLRFGPYDSHLLEYWKEYLQNPDRILFLEYEGLKKEPKAHLRKLADFLSCPFSEEEENENVVEEIIKICSFQSLKEKDVNKNGKAVPIVENKHFFRKGEVGDWNNDLTASMAKKLDQLLQGKLKEAGFSFTYYQPPEFGGYY
ncbi:cytosolic sulfotransferase 15-like [Amaranthus tricolor]|uniref:cytosolic sulfotransferase 15-like n=1 Tax=Amaranthus tricolor TaxID=29722 RepID=UPI00258F0C22|nr:cytosolic sulfotransferase 15-like [Amaranthus tricolor]